MYTFDSRIRYSETDSEGKLTLSGLLNYFQDCTTFHSEELGLGLSYMKDLNMVWVLSAWQIVPERYPNLGEKVTIGTLPYEFRMFMGSRNFVMLDEKGEYLAKANSLWSLIDTTTGKPVAPPQEMIDGYKVEERIPMDYAGRKIPVPEGGSLQEAIPVEKHHLDTNHHVNNGQYVAIAAEFLPEDCVICQMRAEYKKQAFLGDVFYPYVVSAGNLVTVSIQDENGKPFAVVEFTTAAK